jgi:AraC-like DNA-binding protein
MTRASGEGDEVVNKPDSNQARIARKPPGMPAHVLAQLLDSDVLDAEAVVRLRAILQREGVALGDMLKPGAQVPLRWFREVYPALDADQASCLGYLAGEQARLTSYSLLSLPLVSAGSVSEVLHLLTFMPLISSGISASFLERDDTVLVMLNADTGDAVLDRFPVFYCAGALIQVLAILSSESLALAIHFAFSLPPELARHPEYLAGRLRFDAPLSYIQVPKSTLEAVCRFSDPIAYANAVTQLQPMLDALRAPEDVSVRVKRLLEAGPGLQSIDEIACELNVSVSTLKRHLKSSGTSFRRLLEGVLEHRAMLMLTGSSMPLEEIALALGYSDLTNFSHAFKRWTGSSPSVFRRRLPLPMN